MDPDHVTFPGCHPSPSPYVILLLEDMSTKHFHNWDAVKTAVERLRGCADPFLVFKYHYQAQVYSQQEVR